MPGKAAHRPEIDGLRAVAIGAVLAHHAFPGVLPGGFTGVDVFFVISGYLITGIVTRELAEGRFSLWRFYQRRIRRIVPALGIMLAVVGLAGWAILTPVDFYQFAKALAASALFGSNLLFARDADYFASEAGFQPLIHTWTLGVEEQFYLLFPLLLMATFRWRRAAVLPMAALLGCASFALALWLAPRWPLGAFYLLPTRMWELMLGAAAALIIPHIAVAQPARSAAALIGLGLIIAGFWLITPQSPAPGVLFLLPTVGTAFVILGAGRADPTGRLLGWRPVAALGLISFGTYLWHQPLLFFAHYLWFGQLPLAASVLAIAAALALGAASWRFIEQPVRTRAFLREPGVLLMASAAVLALPVAAGAAGYLRALLPRSAAQAQALDALPPPGVHDARVIPAAGALGYVLYGDSHAGQYRIAMDERFGPGALISQSGCLAADGITNMEPASDTDGACRTLPDVMVELVRSRKVKTVFWAQRWERSLYDAATGTDLGETTGTAAPALFAALERTAARLPMDVRIIIIGNAPTAWAAGPVMGQGWLRCRVWRNVACPLDYPASKAEGRAISAALRDFAARNPRFAYVDAAAPLCPGGRCLLMQDGTLNYWDGSHLTTTAARRVVATIPAALAAPDIAPPP